MLGRIKEQIDTDILKLSDCQFFVKCEPQQRSFLCEGGNCAREFSRSICSAGLCCSVLLPAAVHQEGFHPHSQTFLIAALPEAKQDLRDGVQDGESPGLLAMISGEFVECAGQGRASLTGRGLACLHSSPEEYPAGVAD